MADELEGSIKVLEQIEECIGTKKCFILEAGAGSGKTRTLVETLQHILESDSQRLTRLGQRIVCITFTNVAKDEISKRLDNNPLVVVSTIHEFLWSLIEPFQGALREAILDWNDREAKVKIPALEDTITSLPITYSLYGRNFEKGQIFHNEVIDFSHQIFAKYPKISKVTASKYPYIFVDEYQDTSPKTVSLLLDSLLAHNEGKVVIGFFGDAMQKIYNEGIGAIHDPRLVVITKQVNYRCSLAVISLLNNIRPTLKQIRGGKNLDGETLFFVSSGDSNGYKKTVDFLQHKQGWQPEKMKVLMLTHKGIAEYLEYPNLLEAYAQMTFGRERLMKGEDEYSATFHHIENLCSLYFNKNYAHFLQIIGNEGFVVTRQASKQDLKRLMDELMSLRLTGKINEVLSFVFDHKLIVKPPRINEFEQALDKGIESPELLKRKTFYDALMGVSYAEVMSCCRFINEDTPFSTQHGVKGAEYQNVLVVLDDASWNQYKFNDVFSGNKQNQGRYDRTLNLLYVCCSRAKDQLAILTLSPIDAQARQTIEQWFNGAVYDIDVA